MFCVLWTVYEQLNYILCYILAGNNVNILSTGTAPRHGSRGRRSSIEIDEAHESNLKGNVDIWLRIFLPDTVRSDIDVGSKIVSCIKIIGLIWIGSCLK